MKQQCSCRAAFCVGLQQHEHQHDSLAFLAACEIGISFANCMCWRTLKLLVLRDWTVLNSDVYVQLK